MAETRMTAEQGEIGVTEKTIEKPPPPPSLRESITTAVEKTEKAKAPAGTPGIPPTTRKTDVTAPAGVPDKTGRVHDEAGKFVTKTTEPAGSGGAPADLAGSGGGIKRRDMPRSWKQEYKSKWEALDPEINDFLATLEDTREKQFLDGINKYKTAADWANPLRQVLQPYEQQFQQQNGGLAQGIQQLLNLSRFAADKPQEFLEWFARSRGINLAGAQAAADPQAQAFMQSLQPVLAPVLEKVTGLERQLQQFSTSQSQANEAQALSIVNEFLSQKDEAGGLKFPVADDLIDDFAARIAFVRGAHSEWDDHRVLEQAYDDLGWTHPAMRQARFDSELAAKRAKEEAELQAKKAAAVSVTGAPGTKIAGKVDARDLRAVISSAVDRVSR